MTIDFDTTWHKILDENGNVLIDFGRDGYSYNYFLELILSEKQFDRLIQSDIKIKISKKSEKILLEKIKNFKQ